MAGVDLNTEERSGARAILLRGTLRAADLGRIWRRAIALAGRARDQKLILDLSGVDGCDTAGAVLMLEIEKTHGGAVAIEGASERVAALIARVRETSSAEAPPAAPPSPSLREQAHAGWIAATEGFAFLGEAAVAILRLPRRIRLFRMSDLLRTADQAGVRAIPLVLLMGTLIGLILAFQSVIPMRRFGAELYVANLVGISLLRELGPLMAAVILSGRTASAFAAEIGTMKVNQEIDALNTLGLDPMTMLVLPRLVAATIMMPVLAVLMDLAGLVGMTIVMVSFGFPVVTIANQVSSAVRPADLFGGLVKAAVFGAFVGAIGCRSGLSTGVGPRAVGLSATAAVVGGIVTTIILDGIFAILFFRLNL